MYALNKGKFNSFHLKVIALICMTIDHIGYFFSPVMPVPFWFRIIGRISAPLFIFTSVNSMYHTSSRFKYLLRLYLFSAFMAICNMVVGNHFYNLALAPLENNIFSTIFCFCFIIYFIDGIIMSAKRRNVKRLLLNCAILLLFACVDILKISFADSANISVKVFLSAFVPTPLYAEGGIIFVILGVAMYYSIANKGVLTVVYLLFCSLFFVSAVLADNSFINLFKTNVQWLMVLSLPFMLMYNGGKGKSMKYLFYTYYPVHIYLFYILSYFIY